MDETQPEQQSYLPCCSCFSICSDCIPSASPVDSATTPEIRLWCAVLLQMIKDLKLAKKNESALWPFLDPRLNTNIPFACQCSGIQYTAYAKKIEEIAAA